MHSFPLSKFRRRRQDKYLRRAQRLAVMRAAKARIRQERMAAGLLEREPRMVRWFPLELGVRDKVSGETAWVDLRSVRDAAKRLAVILKYYI